MRNLRKQSKTKGEDSLKSASSLSTLVSKLINPVKAISRIILVLFFIMINLSGTNSYLEADGANSTPETPKDPKTVYVETVNEKFYEKLIREVGNYITRMAPTSDLTPKYLVDKCLEYDIDINFVLAQALLESHFGTRGKAAETNSVWNVGTYDDGQILYTYSTADESIEPYLKLINERYLLRITSTGDTIHLDEAKLVEDGAYKNINGLRFASARGYENAMRKLMLRIDSETSIAFYQEILRLPSDELIAYFIPSESEGVDYSLLQASR